MGLVREGAIAHCKSVCCPSFHLMNSLIASLLLVVWPGAPFVASSYPFCTQKSVTEAKRGSAKSRGSAQSGRATTQSGRATTQSGRATTQSTATAGTDGTPPEPQRGSARTSAITQESEGASVFRRAEGGVTAAMCDCIPLRSGWQWTFGSSNDESRMMCT